MAPSNVMLIDLNGRIEEVDVGAFQKVVEIDVKRGAPYETHHLYRCDDWVFLLVEIRPLNDMVDARLAGERTSHKGRRLTTEDAVDWLRRRGLKQEADLLDAETATARRGGRPKADVVDWDREAEIYELWQRARDSGVAKVDFAKQYGMSLKLMGRLLERVAQRKRRSDS